ncbi:RNA polymerase sigma factor [Quillaja saponaria]|uniref:RNA polymerase sigma factor n=1 Tax=Quillaja saponaria TaxID=32244 RepID=A0AAD7LIL3_QUISA|nr:RNA polymerase sigma factor [Quillaja saponaria]
MGLGFRLNLRCEIPIRCSHSFTISPFRPPSSPVRGREVFFNPARLSLLSTLCEEGEISQKDPLRAYTSSTAVQTLDNDLSEIEEMKMNFRKRSRNGLPEMADGTRMSFEEGSSTSFTSLQPFKASHFRLLMENLGVLEGTFADSEAIGLEKDILMQLGKLGALHLFSTCLSRSLKSSNIFEYSSAHPENIGEHKTNWRMGDHLPKVIIRSGKNERKKFRRERAVNANEVPSQSLLSENTREGLLPFPASSVKRISNSKNRRLMVAKNEAEMSKAIKELEKLQSIKEAMEKDTKQVVSLSCWAEACGVDEKVLQQHLYFGWYCRDELIRSTRSLVLYLARNYRGTGIALEDLLQAGYMGVLKGAERFDHTRGYKFSTYVQYWIRKSMSRMVARHARGILVPCSLSRAINQIQKARKSFHGTSIKYPDDNEIAKITGLSLHKIRSASKCLRVVCSIDQKVGDCLAVKYMELTPDTSIKSPEEAVIKQHMRKDINDLLKGLDSRERQILILRFGLKGYQSKSLEDIGKLFQVSKEWIRRIEKKALSKLQNEEIRANLSYYLDP